MSVQMCWQCKEELSPKDEKDEYCSYCGIWLGTFSANKHVIPLSISKWQELKEIAKLPRCIWLDEFLHTFTTWHEQAMMGNNKFDWVIDICNRAERRLLG